MRTLMIYRASPYSLKKSLGSIFDEPLADGTAIGQTPSNAGSLRA